MEEIDFSIPLSMGIRKCIGCNKEFKCLQKSKQEWCSQLCQSVNTGAKLAPMKLASMTESTYIASGKRPEDGKNTTRMSTIEEKSLMPKRNTTKNIQNVKLSAMPKNGKSIMPIVTENQKDDNNGLKTTESDNLNTKGNIMQNTETSNEQKSLQTVSAETLGVDSQKHLMILSKETWDSVSSLDSVKNEMLWLMKSLNRPPEHLGQNPNQFLVLDQDRVRVAAECGKQIIAAMRMKLDLLKFAKDTPGEK